METRIPSGARMTHDCIGEIYLCLKFKWDYKACTCDVYMSGYIKSVLQNIEHTTAKQPQHSPYLWMHPSYSKPTQLTTATDLYEPLKSDKITHKQ